MAPTSALIAACIACLVLSGCTPATTSPPPAASPPTSSSPTTPSGSPSPSPSPSATWSTDQKAAVAAVDAYRATIHRVGMNPAGFSKTQMTAALSKVAGGDVVSANVGSYLDLKKRGFRYEGDPVVLSTKASKPSQASYGTELFVTRCIDQRALRVVDKAGDEVDEAKLGYAVPDFNLRQYTVVRRKGTDRFLVYGLASAKGECGP